MAAAGGSGAGAGSVAPACAACKYQRRRCTPDCPLAEFFPHDRPRVFRNAHRLFGVSNILKTLARAGPDPEKRREAMHCIIYESQAWEVNPSAGCVPIIHGFKLQIRQAELELRRVNAALHSYRSAAAGGGQGGRPFPGDSNGAGDPCASSSSTPSPFHFHPATGNNHDEVHGGGGGMPFMSYGGGDQQQLMMNNTAAASSDEENIALQVQMQPWMMQPPLQYDMMTRASDVADMAGGAPQVLQQQDHGFLADATMMAAPRSHQHLQLQQLIPIQPTALDDAMNYFADSMDEDNETPHESDSMDDDSSDKKAMKTPKMEDANGFK